jgi:hypothetical protein
MNSEMHLSEKVYHLPKLTNTFLLIFPFLGFVFIGFGLLTFLPSLNESFADSVGTTIVGVVFCVVMIGMYTSIKRSRLVLTDDGITSYAWGFRVYTPWQNVIGVSSIQPYTTFPANFRKIWGLQLRQPSVLGMKLADGKRQGKAALETDWWNPVSTMGAFAGILPMSPMINGRNWKESELGMDIQRYAPWIFFE